MLKVGEKIPLDIPVKDLDESEVTLKDYLGKYLVIYFYPKDLTPGCTTEACELRDYNKDIEALGAKVIGISKDTVKLHKKFQAVHNLNFTLLSDEEHKLQDAFGVWSLKRFMGRDFMGTLRATFLINPEGEIVHVWEKVKPEGHGKDIYEQLKLIINNQ